MGEIRWVGNVMIHCVGAHCESSQFIGLASQAMWQCNMSQFIGFGESSMWQCNMSAHMGPRTDLLQVQHKRAPY